MIEIGVARFRWPLFYLGAALIFAIQIGRPIDLPSWHEFDDAAIARNYLREGSNLFLPRIDWRRDGPGYTEMEFPVFPWMISLAYRIFGVHEIAGRLIAMAATVGSVAVFSKLARTLLSLRAAAVASVFFALNRTVVFVASSIQAEAFMLLFYLLAIFHFLLWQDDHGRAHYWISVAATAAAILCKAPSAHIGLLLLFLFLAQNGLAALRLPSFWFFGFASLVPAALWYGYAHSLWLVYHNSMGLSNEFHWFGWDVFGKPFFATSLARLELQNVWLLGGLFIGAFALPSFPVSRATRLSAAWLGIIFVYYLAVIRTAAAPWAWYYHVVSVPPAALLLGAGMEKLFQFRFQAFRFTVLSALSVLAATLLWRWLSRMAAPQSSPTNQTKMAALDLAIAAVALLLTAVLFLSSRHLIGAFDRPNWFAYLTASVGAASTVVFGLHLLAADWFRYGNHTPEFICAAKFSKLVRANALLVSSGGNCWDSTGHSVASDAPQMFYWLDRKGFSLCEGRQSLELLDEYEKRGASYFVADKSSVERMPGFAKALNAKYPVCSECGAVWMFDLTRTLSHDRIAK